MRSPRTTRSTTGYASPHPHIFAVVCMTYQEEEKLGSFAQSIIFTWKNTFLSWKMYYYFYHCFSYYTYHWCTRWCALIDVPLLFHWSHLPLFLSMLTVFFFQFSAMYKPQVQYWWQSVVIRTCFSSDCQRGTNGPDTPSSAWGYSWFRVVGLFLQCSGGHIMLGNELMLEPPSTELSLQSPPPLPWEVHFFITQIYLWPEVTEGPQRASYTASSLSLWQQSKVGWKSPSNQPPSIFSPSTSAQPLRQLMVQSNGSIT